MNHGEIVSFIWGVADLIRDTFKRGKYQDVILPLTVLRRLDCVLAPTKEKVLKRQAELRGQGLQDLDAQLRKVSGFAFYNTSRYDFDKLIADAPHLAANLRNYIAGFSPNMREVLEKFDFDNTISKLNEAGLLFQVLERFKNVDLHPDKIDNPTMGIIFEELIRKFNCRPSALVGQNELIACLHSRRHQFVTRYPEGFSRFVTSMTAPVASGWSVRRVGLAPTGKRRLSTAHTHNGHRTRSPNGHWNIGAATTKLTQA